MDLYQNDELFGDYNLDLYTLKRTEGFDTFSERKVKKFSTYVYDEHLLLRPGPETPLVNFDYLKGLLLSKDCDRMQELELLTSGECKFLDGKSKFEKVAFASFPRTGNSFLRKILE